MDTVHSSRESKKTLLTLFFTKEKLFLAFLMNRCTKGAVRLVFDRLEKRMGTHEFASVFEYILTDQALNWALRMLWKQACGLEKSMVFEDQIVKWEFSPHKKAAPCGFLSPKAHVINCLLYFFLSAIKGSAGQRCAGCQQSHEPKGDIADITGPRDI